VLSLHNDLLDLFLIFCIEFLTSSIISWYKYI